MSLTEAAEFECPYCMTVNDLEIDEENDVGQEQVLDCQICCQPIVVFIENSDYGLQVVARQENE